MTSSCFVCGSPGEPIVHHPISVTSESKVLGVSSTLETCTHCGHLFTTLPIDLERYYTHDYDATLTDSGFDEIVTLAGGEVVFRTDLDYGLFKASALKGLSHDAAIYEYGCGHGRILSRLARDGFRNLTAFDVGERYREPLARIIGLPRVHIGAEPRAGEFDLSCSFFALEHHPRPAAAFLHLAARTRVGGLVYVVVPNFLTNAVDLACADHANHFSPTSFAELACASGLDVLSCDVTSNIGATVLIARNTGSGPRPLTTSDSQRELARRSADPYVAHHRRLASLNDRLRSTAKICLYGAGFNAALVAATLQGREITCVFDANPRKQGTVRFGARVLPPDAIVPGKFDDATLVVCVNNRIAAPIAEQCRPAFRDVVVV